MLRLIIALGCLLYVTAETCRDNNKHCPRWKSYCYTNDYVKRYCLLSCGRCTTDPPPTRRPTDTPNGNGKCGISKVSQSRVVNGETAKPGAWPWLVSLQSQSGFHFCGGSILTPNWILTASHCVERRISQQNSIKVVAGAHNRKVRESTQQAITSKRIIMHPDYKKGGGLNADVALIELATPLRLNERVVKACMPRTGVYPASGKTCFIAGWGTTTHPGSSPDLLQQASLPVVQSPHRGCHNNREVVCVGHGFGKRPDGSQHPNACRGDSGGPLMCQKSDGSWQVDGIASYVYTYCKYYTAYAPVNKYLPWIKQYVSGL